MHGARVLAAAACVLALSGCATAAGADTVIAPPRASEPWADTRLGQYYSQRWADISQASPSLTIPAVDPLETVQDATWLTIVMACVSTYGLDRGDRTRYDIGELVCEMQYPSHGGVEISRSAPDRDATWGYFSQQLQPCLLLGGHRAASPVQEDPQSGQRYLWRMTPGVPTGAVERFQFERCPRPA